MHPIERLRYVAAVSPERPALLAREAATALLGCADPAELVVACRRLLDRQPAVGPLWWVASKAVVAAEPDAALRQAVEELEMDPTGAHLGVALTESPGHPVVEVLALGEGGLLVSRRSAAAAGLGQGGDAVWGAAGVGRALPKRVWDAALERLHRAGARTRAELVSPRAVSLVVMPDGLVPFDEATSVADCPIAPELLVAPR